MSSSFFTHDRPADTPSSISTAYVSTEVYPLRYRARSVPGKSAWIEVDWQEFSEESSFTSARRLRGPPKDRALSYLFARDVRDRIICELGGEPIEFGEVTVHHRKHPEVHVAKYLGIACFRHNSISQSPVERQVTSDVDSVKEKNTPAAIDMHGADPILRISFDNYPLYRKWLEDQVASVKEVSIDYAINGGAFYLREKTGTGSPQACRTYLKMLISGKVVDVREKAVRKPEVVSSLDLKVSGATTR